MSEPSPDAASLPRGYRITPGPGGVGAELRLPQPSWGWLVVAVATVWCALWDFALLATIGIGPKVNWSGWPEDSVSRLIGVIGFFWIPGIVVTALTLHQIFVRTTWTLSPRHVTRRYRFLRLSMQLDDDVINTEIVHGLWRTGGGASDTLRLGLPSWIYLQLHKVEHESEAIPAEVLALATAVAGHLAVPMRVTETVVPGPTSD